MGHPHNMYLEMLLDGGVMGLSVALAACFGLAWISAMLFRRRDQRLLSVVGGMTLAYLAAFMIAGLGSQTMYPRHSTAALVCLAGMSLRGWTEIRRLRQAPVMQVSIAGGGVQPASW